MTVTDLSLLQIDRLKAELDMSYGSTIGNWKHLAHELLGDDPTLEDDVKNLELHYYGGGNPALELFRQLARSNPSATVQSLREKAKNFHRNDIVETIDKVLEGRNLNEVKLIDLDLKDKERICTLMNLNIPGVYNWEMFANEYGYTYNEIKSIQTTIREGQSYSPTKKLFELFRQVRPKMKISHIKEKCVKLGRNDVAMLLNEFMNKKPPS